MLAAKLANIPLGRTSDKTADWQLLPASLASMTQARAADLLNVSGRTVASAKSVRNHSVPELIEAAERG